MLNHVTHTPLAILCLIIFIAAYSLVIAEEFLQLRKSKPVMVASGLMWILVAIIAQFTEVAQVAEVAPHIAHSGVTGVSSSTIVTEALEKYLYEFGSLFLFIVVAMTYINAMEDRNIFQALRSLLVKLRLSYRQLFWLTGFLAFFISSIADNLTTALAMSAVILAVGKDKPTFVVLACINLVVAANAGGVFTPFGDITTLMVWQAGILPIHKFTSLFLPALINFMVPAVCMHFALPKGTPSPIKETIRPIRGGITIVLLFLLTIATTVLLHHFLHLPPVIGMMLGLGYLQFFAYYTKRSRRVELFDVFPMLQRIEWDTLLFFYGVILCVGALGTLGYLNILSTTLYHDLSNFISTHTSIPNTSIQTTTLANVIIGLISAVIDNIPVMFSVITMHPTMSETQWLLVTLTAGVGGSLLSIGSAAGVALMGQAPKQYTFMSHLKWSWAIGLGYIASIVFHLMWSPP